MLVPDKQKIDVRISPACDLGTLHHHGRSVVAPHGIERDRETAAQGIKPILANMKRLGLGDFDDFAPSIMATGFTYVVRPLDLAAIRAFDARRCLDCVVRPAHVTPRFRGLLLGDRHIKIFRRCNDVRLLIYLTKFQPTGKPVGTV